MIKIQDTDKERWVFIKSDEVFKIYGGEDKVLSPFNDYTYEWLNSFFYNVIDLINNNDFETLEELENQAQNNIYQWVDSETSVYTIDLTKWLSDNNNNVYYLTEALEEYSSIKDGFKLLQIAQYKAIEEIYNNALGCLIKDLEQFE